MKDYLIDSDIKLIDAKVSELKVNTNVSSMIAIAELLKAKAALVGSLLGVVGINMAEKLHAEMDNDLGDPSFKETAAGGAGEPLSNE